MSTSTTTSVSVTPSTSEFATISVLHSPLLHSPLLCVVVPPAAVIVDLTLLSCCCLTVYLPPSVVGLSFILGQKLYVKDIVGDREMISRTGLQLGDIIERVSLH